MIDKHSDPDWAWECYNPRCPDPAGHEQWECPKGFAETFPGRVLPGWTAEGTKDPNGWGTDNEPTDQTRRGWAALVAAGFFKNHPFPNSDNVFPDPSKAGAGG